MVAILYIDTCMNRFPSADKEPRHCTRISALLSGDLTARIETLIRPDDWAIDPATQDYLRASPEEIAEGMTVRLAFEAMVPLLRAATEILSFNAPFHKKAIESLCRDNGCALSDFTAAPWQCLMAQSGSAMRFSKRSPKLKEAYQFFTGLPMPDHEDWDRFASQQVFACRHIHKGLMQRARADA